jgi:hypothetical protein
MDKPMPQIDESDETFNPDNGDDDPLIAGDDGDNENDS